MSNGYEERLKEDLEKIEGEINNFNRMHPFDKELSEDPEASKKAGVAYPHFDDKYDSSQGLIDSLNRRVTKQFCADALARVLCLSGEYEHLEGPYRSMDVKEEGTSYLYRSSKITDNEREHDLVIYQWDEEKRKHREIKILFGNPLNSDVFKFYVNPREAAVAVFNPEDGARDRILNNFKGYRDATILKEI